MQRKQASIEAKLRAKLAALEKNVLRKTTATTTTTTSSSSSSAASAATKHICYLCRKKFKTPEMLLRHNAESVLHKENLRKKLAAAAASAN